MSTSNKYIDAVKHALAQHAVCSIARDAASKYPNGNRVARGASNTLEAINQLDAIGATQQNMVPVITQQLQQPVAPVVPDATAQLMTLVKDIDARLKKANL
tara:strand:- start:137 stop:439 length:303 start_codon:yes stop_codon:yes gene_type:complete